ncbi:acyl carrier protein [Streptomyces werraensis]|nr:acyl carrier protein [Streptomyces werraensis]
MVVTLRNRLIAVTGVRLPATVAFTHPTPRQLARHLFSLLTPADPGPADTAVDTAAGTAQDTAPATGPDAARGTAPDERPESRSDDDLYALIDRGYV